jgi:hypothetical protein
MGILRSLFGPSQDEIWSEVSREMGARFQAGGLMRSGRVDISNGVWDITLDTYVVSTGKSASTFTRLRAPYVNENGFRFNVYRQGGFSSIAKMLGTQDIVMGDPVFDGKFVVQSNSEPHIRRLLSNPQIRSLIEADPDVHFQVADDDGWFKSAFPAGVDELYFQTYGLVTDIERLKRLFNLFALVLNELCLMGSAYQNDPGVRI